MCLMIKISCALGASQRRLLPLRSCGCSCPYITHVYNVYIHIYIYIYIYTHDIYNIYIYIYADTYTIICPEKFYEHHVVPICSLKMFYTLARARVKGLGFRV